jgi:hypothetical protein
MTWNENLHVPNDRTQVSFSFPNTQANANKETAKTLVLKDYRGNLEDWTGFISLLQLNTHGVQGIKY